MKIARTRTWRIAVLTAGLSIICANAFAAQEESPKKAAWQLEKQEGAVNVYSQPVENSPYLAVKATVLINASATRVSALMGDGDGCVAWRAKCKSSQVIEAISEHERYVHMVLNLPWPVSDRDLVLHTKTTIDTQTKTATVSLQSVSGRYPIQDYVRAESSGQFMIREIDEKQAEFTYIMHVNLGGSLPVGSVNSGLTDATFDDLKLLKRLAEN